MFVTTLLNPKGIVFVLVIVPYLRDGDLTAAVPYLAGLACMIVGVACTWIVWGRCCAGAPEPHSGLW